MPPSSPPVHVILVGLGSAGDVHPFMGLGREMRRRGHRVTLLAAGWFRDLAERAGLEFVDPCPELDFAAAIRDPRIWHAAQGSPVILDLFVRPLLEPVYRSIELLNATQSDGGRMIVVASSLALGARVASIAASLTPVAAPPA